MSEASLDSLTSLTSLASLTSLDPTKLREQASATMKGASEALRELAKDSGVSEASLDSLTSLTSLASRRDLAKKKASSLLASLSERVPKEAHTEEGR